MEKMSKQDLVTVMEEEERSRGHSKKIRERQCVKDIGTNSFPHRTLQKWNALSEEIVTPPNVQNFKHKLDKWRY